MMGRVGLESLKGMHLSMGLVGGRQVQAKGNSFEGLAMGVRGFALSCSGHPYMFHQSMVAHWSAICFILRSMVGLGFQSQQGSESTQFALNWLCIFEFE